MMLFVCRQSTVSVVRTEWADETEYLSRSGTYNFKSKPLKGTDYGIHRDYSKEIVDARKKLLKAMKQLRETMPEVELSMHYPAKLRTF